MDSSLKCRPATIAWKFYEKNRKKAFFDGIWKPVKEKRWGTEYYDLYHFFMPERTFWQAKLLRRYFHSLDALTASQLPENRFRQTPIEIFDTALDVIDLMRRSTWTYNSQYIGSSHISPIAWACLGYDKDKRITCRHHFKTFYELVKHYDSQMAEQKQFNVMKIYRKQDDAHDKLSTFHCACDISYNRVMAIAIAFLFDLVTNSGPDSDCYLHLYTNNRVLANIDAWKHVYDNVIKSRTKLPEYRRNNIYNRSCKVELRCLYSEVMISDIATDFPIRNIIEPDFEI